MMMMMMMMMYLCRQAIISWFSPKGWWCCATGKVTAAMAELATFPPGLWLVTCGIQPGMNCSPKACF